jgi:RNA polymerase sigma-70 factor (ECF subfamily)
MSARDPEPGTRGPVDRSALEQVYRDYGHIVLRRALQLLASEADAREVLHDVFVSLLDRPEQFQGRSSLVTFLYSMTTNACRNLVRNRQTRAALTERELGWRPPVVVASNDERQLAWQLLANLPERLACIAVYYFIDEMTHDEIADIVGVSRRQVGHLVARAQKEMRQCAA